MTVTEYKQGKIHKKATSYLPNEHLWLDDITEIGENREDTNYTKSYNR